MGAGRVLLSAAIALLGALAPQPAAAQRGPQIKHLFVIVLENKDQDVTFGPNPPAPFLATELRQDGAYIPGYFGTGHESLDNYIAMVSGQPPNVQTQADCQLFTEMTPGSLDANGIA